MLIYLHYNCVLISLACIGCQAWYCSNPDWCFGPLISYTITGPLFLSSTRRSSIAVTDINLRCCTAGVCVYTVRQSCSSASKNNHRWRQRWLNVWGDTFIVRSLHARSYIL